MTTLEALMKEFDEKFPVDMFPSCNEWLDENKISPGMIKSFLTKVYEQARQEADGQYIIHEVHGEGGKTLDGKTLYWAKVRRKAISSLKDKGK